jgi:hypothetical protein
MLDILFGTVGRVKAYSNLEKMINLDSYVTFNDKRKTKCDVVIFENITYYIYGFKTPFYYSKELSIYVNPKKSSLMLLKSIL